MNHPLLTLLSAAWLACATTAQPPAAEAIALRDLGTTTAIGGPINLCCFGGADAMVTFGDGGDLLWWNTASWSVRARFEMPDRHVQAAAMHPTEPMLVVASLAEDCETGAIRGLDLTTGKWQRIAPELGTQLHFVDDGKRLLARVARERQSEQHAFSFVDGAFAPCAAEAADQLPEQVKVRRSVATTKVVSRTQPSPLTWDCSASVDSWIDHSWSRPDGTVVAADVQGQLHIWAPNPTRSASCPHTRRSRRVSSGRATAVTWPSKAWARSASSISKPGSWPISAAPKQWHAAIPRRSS